MARTITFNILSNIEVQLRKDESNPASVTVVYEVRSAEGDVSKQTFAPTLTPTEISQLRNFVTNVIIPQIRAREEI